LHSLQRLQRTIGNQAVQRLILLYPQTAPDIIIHRQAEKLDLPWKHGDYSLFEQTSSGIRVLVGTAGDVTAVTAAIPGIAKQIAAGNARIPDPSYRVRSCLIVPTTTRFALFDGDPVLMLDPSNADAATAAHEMGHAIFHALDQIGSSGSKQAGPASAFRLRIADIYLRLSETKEHTVDEHTHPAGLWIADPSQWAPKGAMEHPWDDPDEFFASAREAWVIDRRGFTDAIARMTKIDPKVKKPAQELVALLAAFLGKGQLPKAGPAKANVKAATEELKRIKAVSSVKDTIMGGTLLDWLVNPENRPKKSKPRPSLETP
jgi:hypothetical protein